MNPLLILLSKLDLTEIFKTKGNLRRWSAKRTIGGLIVITACSTILDNGVSWEAVIMCGIGIVPISLSFFEKN